MREVPTIPTDAPVLLTGATGYVAGSILERLLDAGVTVHATVRDASRRDRLAHLEALAADRPGELRFFSADLTEPGAFHEAMEGCSHVFHVASPYRLDVDDPQRDLVEPAVRGTEHVLAAVEDTPTVERVVLTSSGTAMFGDNVDLAATQRGVFDEQVWNTTSSLSHQPYSYSKVAAERRAWEIADAQDRWRLVVVNPTMVLGPGVAVHEGAESYRLFQQLVDGSMPAYPDIHIGMVDVRDVADAHVRAAYVPDAEGRHLLCAVDGSYGQIVEALRGRDDVSLPRTRAPKPLLWLLGPTQGVTRRWVTRNVGHPWRGDASKSVRELGVRYRPLAETVNDMADQVLRRTAA